MARGRRLSDAQRAMIVKAYEFFLEGREECPELQGRTRELINKCIGTPTSTVAVVWKAYKESKSSQSTETLHSIEERRGRPCSYEDEDVSPSISAFINKCNKERQPITAQMVSDEVLRCTSIPISRRAMARLLRRLGYRYIKGENRPFLADSVQNVAYRATYLQRKVANRNRNNNPIKPEVYLDESICMIAAGVLYRQGNALRGHIVEQSFKDWVANRKGSEGDYHGNFDASQFEMWFTDLCQQLSTLHDPCLIYMDGAAYHKRYIMPAPTTRTKKAEIVQWLQHNCVPHNDKLYKAQLLDLVRAHKPPPFYMAVAIATTYGHCIHYTPPYHPELQPIELIWGNMKGWIGRNPAKCITELEEKVATSKQQITSKEWRNAYKEIQKEVDQYLRALDADDIECTDAGEGEENSEASDSHDEGL